MQKPRLYFDFLDSKRGRAVFIAFTMLLILEVARAVEIILAILVFSISILGLIAGWGESSDGVSNSASGSKDVEQPNKKDQQSAGPSSKQPQRKLDLNMAEIAANAVKEYTRNQFGGGIPQKEQ